MVSKYHHSGSIAYPCPPIQSQEHSRISSARKVKSVFQIQHGCLGSTLFWDTAMYQGLKTTKQWCCCWLRSPTFFTRYQSIRVCSSQVKQHEKKVEPFLLFLSPTPFYLPICSLMHIVWKSPKISHMSFFLFYHFPSIFVLYITLHKDPQCVVAISIIRLFSVIFKHCAYGWQSAWSKCLSTY